jgi:hypothetical protein
MPRGSAILERPEYPSYTMAEAIRQGIYYAIQIPGWAASWDTAASAPDLAALQVGGFCKEMGTLIPDTVRVLRHRPNSRIGCAVLEECGTFPTARPDSYEI